MLFYIYNFERKQWWLPNMRGYTGQSVEAGCFTVEQAAEIIDQANLVKREDIAVPVNRVYFDTGDALRHYADILNPTLPLIKVGEFIQ